MHSLIYVSTSRFRFDDYNLQELVHACAMFNDDNQITGCLIYNGINFMQLIEGPDDSIDACMERIRGDNRHNGLIIIRREAVSLREFPNWSMIGRLVPNMAMAIVDSHMSDIMVAAREDTKRIFNSFVSLQAA